MGFSRFRAGVTVRTAVLFVTIVAIAEMMARTQWYMTITLCIAGAFVQTGMLVRFATQSSREVARFLDAVSFDDISQSFSGLLGDNAHRELGAAMTRVLNLLRTGRAEREEQARYLQTLIAHVPVALLSVNDDGRVQLLNVAARRLFETAVPDTAQFARYGEAFAVGMESLRPGSTAILRMERTYGTLQLKAAATDVALGGLRRRLISLQNIETEMSAQEMAAWQTVIRVMAHEVMNSLTPVSSLAATAHDLVSDVLNQMSAGDPRANSLMDAREALETVARRSEGLLHFVQNHRRLIKPLVTQIQVAPMQRVFARIHRLLAADLAARAGQVGHHRREWPDPLTKLDLAVEQLSRARVTRVGEDTPMADGSRPRLCDPLKKSDHAVLRHNARHEVRDQPASRRVRNVAQRQVGYLGAARQLRANLVARRRQAAVEGVAQRLSDGGAVP